MTGTCHETSEAVTQAAEWLQSRPTHRHPIPIVPALKNLFGLTAREACEAIAQARRANGDNEHGS